MGLDDGNLRAAELQRPDHDLVAGLVRLVGRHEAHPPHPVTGPGRGRPGELVLDPGGGGAGDSGGPQFTQYVGRLALGLRQVPGAHLRHAHLGLNPRAVHGGQAGGHGRRVRPVPGDVLSAEDTGQGDTERENTAQCPGAERQPEKHQADGDAPCQQDRRGHGHQPGYFTEADVGELPGHMAEPVGLCGPGEGDCDPVRHGNHRGGDQPRQNGAEGKSNNRVGNRYHHAHQGQPQGVEARDSAAANQGHGRRQQQYEPGQNHHGQQCIGRDPITAARGQQFPDMGFPQPPAFPYPKGGGNRISERVKNHERSRHNGRSPVVIFAGRCDFSRQVIKGSQQENNGAGPAHAATTQCGGEFHRDSQSLRMRPGAAVTAPGQMFGQPSAWVVSTLTLLTVSCGPKVEPPIFMIWK